MKSTRPFSLTLCLILIGTLTTAGFGQDQPKSDTEGIFLNIHLNGSQWDLDDDTDFGELPQESGPGMGLAFGYGASQAVTLFMAFDGARISDSDADQDYTLVHFDIGGMVTFLGRSTPFRPFLKASFTARTAEFDLDDVALSTFGAGFSAGAGLMFFLSPGLAIVGDGTATWGTMTEITTSGIAIETDIGARSGRLNLGLTWFPGR